MLDFIFWGTDEFAVTVLTELTKSGWRPKLVITTPDQPKGRKLLLTPSPVKIWAKENDIPLLQPDKLTDLTASELGNATFYLVASYGKIIPEKIISWPERGIVNLHPSLLPQYRGPTPIQTAILNGDKETGVSLILIDQELDHGPLLAQVKVEIGAARTYPELREKLAKISAEQVIKTVPAYLAREIKPQEQNHAQATYTKFIEKADGLVDLEIDKPEIIYRRFRAYQPWPGIYFKNEREQRIKITACRLDENNKLIIERVIPEGRKGMTWDSYLNGLGKG